MQHFDRNELFVCDCSDVSHNIIFQIWEWPDEPADLSVHVNLTLYPSFWKRIKLGIRYIFGYKSRFGQYDVFSIRENDIERLQKLLSDFKELRQK